ncbi:hypothetical protein BD408DRAFT_422382 [Parasitella parasitica]|nr:hypothetical protein BD408DRAFT_422382 [Parasitella parasitica]
MPPPLLSPFISAFFSSFIVMGLGSKRGHALIYSSRSVYPHTCSSLFVILVLVADAVTQRLCFRQLFKDWSMAAEHLGLNQMEFSSSPDLSTLFICPFGYNIHSFF